MTTREEELGTYEMLWDCGACGTAKLLGLTHRHCPACGAPQEASKRYFPSDEEKVATLDHVYTGVDQQCAACGSPSAISAHHCPNCGAPLAEGKAVATKGPERIAETSVFSSSNAERDGEVPVPRQGPAPKRLPVALLVFVALAAFAIFAFTRKKSSTLDIVAHHWRMERPIEVYELVAREAWRDELPSTATGVACHEEARSTRSVPDGETCERVRKDLGNGAFKETRECKPKFRDETIMGTRCRFEAPAWRVARTDRAEGQGLASVRRFAGSGAVRTGLCLGCEREGRVEEVFELEVRAAGSPKTERCAVSESRWRALADGASVVAAVRAVGGGVVCASLE